VIRAGRWRALVLNEYKTAKTYGTTREGLTKESLIVTGWY
jgi:hypothetical protein